MAPFRRFRLTGPGFRELKRRSRATISEMALYRVGFVVWSGLLFYCPHLASLAAVGALY